MKLFDNFKICKFEDKEDYFFLNSVKVNYKFKGCYFSEERLCPHFEFTTENKEPCLLSETGYRSDFFNCIDFETFEDLLKHEIDVIINYDDRGNKKKKQVKYDLEFNIQELKNRGILYEVV